MTYYFLLLPISTPCPSCCPPPPPPPLTPPPPHLSSSSFLLLPLFPPHKLKDWITGVWIFLDSLVGSEVARFQTILGMLIQRINLASLIILGRPRQTAGRHQWPASTSPWQTR